MNTTHPKPRFYLNPYKIILRNKIVKGFADFSHGNYQSMLKLYTMYISSLKEITH